MQIVNKTMIFAFFIVILSGYAVMAMDQEHAEAEKRAAIARLNKEAAENELKAAQAKQAQQNLSQNNGVPSKETPVGHVAHNIQTETERGLKSAQNWLNGKGWNWKK